MDNPEWEEGARVQTTCRVKGKEGLSLVKTMSENRPSKRSADNEMNTWPPKILYTIQYEDTGNFSRRVTGPSIKVNLVENLINLLLALLALLVILSLNLSLF